MKDVKTKGSASELIPVLPVERCILTIRGKKVILDADLAALCCVSTKALNQAVRRNSARFPRDFTFLLGRRPRWSQIVTTSAGSSSSPGRRRNRRLAVSDRKHR